MITGNVTLSSRSLMNESMPGLLTMASVYFKFAPYLSESGIASMSRVITNTLNGKCHQYTHTQLYTCINIQRTGLVLQESVAATDNTRINAGHQPGGRQHTQLAGIANAPLVGLLMDRQKWGYDYGELYVSTTKNSLYQWSFERPHSHFTHARDQNYYIKWEKVVESGGTHLVRDGWPFNTGRIKIVRLAHGFQQRKERSNRAVEKVEHRCNGACGIMAVK